MSDKLEQAIRVWNECCELETADYESAMLWQKRNEFTDLYDSLNTKQQKHLIKTLEINPE